MNAENKFARLMRNTGAARFFIPVGLVLIIVGIILLSMNTGKYEETVGRNVVASEPYYDEDGNAQYDIDFVYTVDGKDYNGTFTNLQKSDFGDTVKVYYDPENPEKITNSKLGGIIGPIMIGLGALAAAFGVFKTVKAFQKSKELDKALPGGKFPNELFDGIKQAAGVTEYYFRYDGNTFKPGFLIEDADRKVLFEGKMLKNALVGARLFEFNDHTTGKVAEHEVGHTVTQTLDNELFSMNSSFKFDGENVWDVLHDRGVRIATDMHSKFPYMLYNVIKDGAAFARIENTGMYVHEEDEAKHTVVIPTGRMYYRFWTPSNDFDTLFLTMFAMSECEQAVVE